MDPEEKVQARERLLTIFREKGPLTLAEIKDIDGEAYEFVRRHITTLLKTKVVKVILPRAGWRREVYGIPGQRRAEPKYDYRPYSALMSLIPKSLASDGEPLTAAEVADTLNEAPSRIAGALSTLAKRGLVTIVMISGVPHYTKEVAVNETSLVDKILGALLEEPGSTVDDLVEETKEVEHEVASAVLAMRRVGLVRMSGSGYFLTSEGVMTAEQRVANV